MHLVRGRECKDFRLEQENHGWPSETEIAKEKSWERACRIVQGWWTKITTINWITRRAKEENWSSN